MEFGLSEDQVMLQETVRRFVAEEVPLDRVRKVAQGDETAASALAGHLSELGLDGLLVPEADGGSGLGVLDAVLVQECFGYGVVPARFLSNSVAAFALRDSDSSALAGIVNGEAGFGIALNDMASRRDGSGLLIHDDAVSGVSLMAMDARGASRLLCLANDAIHTGVPGRIEPIQTIDRTREFSKVELDSIDRDVRIRSVDRVFAAACVLVAADTLGAAQSMLDKAVAYAGEREQFGRVIGSFQAVKHLCAEMAAKLEPSRALLWHAAHALDVEDDEALAMAFLAKAHVSEVGTFIARTSTEVHGGMGFTDLVGLHYWFKRIGVNRQILGSPMALRERAARQQGLVA
ncbi:MAG: acyl-CoA dehydrogenase family protein [Hyphomonas sp.]|nr:acyl-CoA dehydrogenase family protein [Hyphomonas sp.]